ncbi:DVUA0089 family protein [Dactylococcopsis salina]|uniref:Pre-peptidase n=1 Tax=Dactylococcopsis salina (strain PCC 8305) TaxID=13035 RepID=K9YVC1_DACS8|nr:DVUA0089 family protein [Dactylococcopsis salina]AFZ50839.1 putative pre-peptidase [Dactylococcopsis salina PCC 8305]
MVDQSLLPFLSPEDQLLAEIRLETSQILTEFAQDAHFISRLETVFGQNLEKDLVTGLQETLLNGEFLSAIEIEVLPSLDLNGALGAYAAAINQIYLSQELISSSPQKAITILLEEVGHSIDTAINTTDTRGDEGAIFALEVLGNQLTPQEIDRYQEEDDRATITVNGERLKIEQASFTVTNTDDRGNGSLRDAINQANNTSGLDSITFDVSLTGETISLESGQLEITDDLNLEGEEITITASKNSRIFLLDDGNENNNIDVSIDGLTLIDGVAENGGAILNRENLVLRNSELRGNTATSDGGGILNSNGNLSIDRSTLAENTANLGGAIDDDGSGDREFNLTNSTISGNEASGNVGGVDNSANLRITNSTISGNTSEGDAGGVKNSGTLTVNNSTFFKNLAFNRGGGVFNYGQFNLTNSIIAKSVGGDINNRGVVNLQGVNLIEDDSEDGSEEEDLNLSPLQDNGGATFTHLPLENSPAIDAGDNSTIPENLTFDQRGEGFDRVIETIDLGAVEVQPEGSPPSIDDQSFDDIKENSPLDTYVGKIVANDPEEDEITFRTEDDLDLDGDGNPSFRVDENTGEIRVGDSGELDFETRESITFDVIVSDGGRENTATITVNLKDEKESDLEPNDTLDNAIETELSSETPGNKTYNLAIGDGGLQEKDVDLFAMQVNAGDILSANVNAGGSSLDGYITVFDSVGSEIVFDFDNPLVKLNVPGTDTYYVGVSSLKNRDYSPLNTASRAGGSTGDYSIALSVTPESSKISEPNDTIGQATPIDQEDFTANSFIGDNRTLDNRNLDVDLYQLTLSQGETATIDIDTKETPFDTAVRIFKDNGQELVFNNSGQAPGENVSSVDPYVEFTAAASGRYFVGVSSAINKNYRGFQSESGERAGGQGAYEITINQPQPEAITPEDPTNDTLESAIGLEVGTSVEGTIGDRSDFITVPGLDVDLYRVALDSNQEINIELNRQSTLDPVLRLFDANGKAIGFNDDIENSNDAFLNFNAPQAGDYIIGVSGFGNESYDPTQSGSGAPFASSGSYELNVTEVIPAEIVAGAEEENDTFENATVTDLNPNDLGSFKQSNAIGNNVNLDAAGFDVDLFRVELDQTTRLTAAIDTRNIDSDLNSLLHVFNSDGDSVAFNDDKNSDRTDAFLEFIPPSSGTYYVGVSGLGNEAYNPLNAGSGNFAGSTGDYDIEISLTEAISEETPSNDTLENSIEVDLESNLFSRDGFIGDNTNTTGDVDLYQVNLQATDQITINADATTFNSDLDGFLRLFDSNGQEIVADDDSGNFSDPELSFTASEDDTYYIGLSAFANRDYDPLTETDRIAGTTGEYSIRIERTTAIVENQALQTEIRPTVNNDTGFINTDNDATIDVLANDLANDANGVLEITDFDTTTEKGGTVELDDSQSRLVYTRNPDFTGVDRFTYTASNESGGSAQGTVEVTVNRPAGQPTVEVGLNIRPVSGKEEQLDNGLQIGDEFLLDVEFFDLITENNPSNAVTSGYADLLFDPNVLQVVEDDNTVDGEDGVVDGIVRNPDYITGRTGTVRNFDGIVEEVGGGAVVFGEESFPEENRVFSLHLQAVGGGNTGVLASRAGEATLSTVTILSELADQRHKTNFAEINVGEGEGGLNAFPPLTNETQPLALPAQGMAAVETAIAAMEIEVLFQNDSGESIEEVTVGEEFDIVLSARDLRLDNEELEGKFGVFSAFADVIYDTVLIDVQEASNLGTFESPVLDLNDGIAEGSGLVDELGGTNVDLTPVDETQEFAVLRATATAPGDLKIETEAPDRLTSQNTLFGIDRAVNDGTIYGENQLTITSDETPSGNADLVITEFDAVTDHVLQGKTDINLTIENQGEGDASGFQVEVLYYEADDLEELNTATPTVVETLAFSALEADTPVTETEAITLPLEKLIAEALADDPSVFGEDVPPNGFPSNNVDFLGVRIVNSDSTNESEAAFGNNGLEAAEKGVNVDDIAFFPWDILSNNREGVEPNQEDELIADGVVTNADSNAVFRNIGRLIDNEEALVEDPNNGLDLTRLDLDLDGAISPVDAVRVANRIGYEINPTVFEDAVG